MDPRHPGIRRRVLLRNGAVSIKGHPMLLALAKSGWFRALPVAIMTDPAPRRASLGGMDSACSIRLPGG